MASAGAANVLIKLQLVGDRQIRTGLKGVADESVKQGQRVTREAERSTKAREQAERRMRRSQIREAQRAYAEEDRARKKTEREAAKSEERKARDAKKQRDKDARDAERQRKLETRNADRAAKEKADAEVKQAERAEQRKRMLRRSAAREAQRAWQEEQQRLRTQERLRRQQRTIGERRFAAGAAVAGVIAGGAVSAARDSQGVLGIRTQDQILGDTLSARQSILAQVVSAGGTPEQANQIFERTVGAARNANVSPVEAIQAVSRLQEQFSLLGTALENGDQGLNDFFRTLEGNMQFARAASDSTENVSMAMGALASQFHLTAQEQVEARGLLFQGAQDGALTMRDFAEQMPTVIAPFLNARGAEGQGLAGLRELTALGQTLQFATNDPARTRTYMTSMLQNLSDVNVQERLAAPLSDGGLGIQATKADGSLRSVGDIAHQIAMLSQSNPGLVNSTTFRSIFHDAESSAGFAILAQQDLAGNGMLGRVGVDANAGNAAITRTAAAMNADSSGRAMRLVNEREASVMMNSDTLIESNLALAEGLTGLENEFPRLTMALDRITPILTALFSVAAAKAILPGSFFSTLAGRTEPLSGAVMDPTTGAATYANLAGAASAARAGGGMGGLRGAGARLSAFNATLPDLAASTTSVTTKLMSLSVAASAYDAAVTGTLGLMDRLQSNGFLGDRLERESRSEGGSFSAAYQSFDIMKILRGESGFVDAVRTNWGSGPTKNALAGPQVERDAWGRPVTGDEHARNTQAQTREVVGALRDVATAVRTSASTQGGNTGNTAANGQQQ